MILGGRVGGFAAGVGNQPSRLGSSRAVRLVLEDHHLIGRGHRGRRDENERAIIDALLAAGCSVQSLAVIGCGCPDLLVGRRGYNYLLEVKDGKKPPSERALTPAEKKFRNAWRGLIYVVESIDDALEVVHGA